MREAGVGGRGKREGGREGGRPSDNCAVFFPILLAVGDDQTPMSTLLILNLIFVHACACDICSCLNLIMMAC